MSEPARCPGCGWHLGARKTCPNCGVEIVTAVPSPISIEAREWNYSPTPDGEPYTDKDGNEVVGFHDRTDDQDADALLVAFEGFEGRPLLLRPILARWASEVESKINGWGDGTFVRCTTRAKNPMPMWQIEVVDSEPQAEGGERP